MRNEQILTAVFEVRDDFSGTMQKFENQATQASETFRKEFTSAYESAMKIQQQFHKQTSQNNGFMSDSASGIKAQIPVPTEFSVKNAGNKSGVMWAAAFGAAAGPIIRGAADKTLGIFTSAFESYVDLEKMLTRNKAMMGVTDGEFEQLKSQVKSLGAETIYTAQQVAQAHQYQAMAGMKTNEILAVTPTLLNLATAAGEDLGRVSDIITDNLSAFGLGVEDAERFADILASMANATNTDISMMGEAFKYIGSTSRAMGEDMEEVAIMLGMLADNSIKSSQAGTSLRSIYARLAKPTEDMRKQLEKTQTTFYDSERRFKGLRTIMKEVKPQLDKMSDAERNLWLSTVLGTEGMAAWNAMMNNSAENTKKAENAVRNAHGATKEFAEKMNGTYDAKVQQFQSAWDGLKLALGEGIAPVVTETLKTLTGYINKLTASGTFDPQNIQAFFNTITNNASTALKTLEGVAIAYYGIRAAAGDPTAWVKLGLITSQLGYSLGKDLANKHLEERQKKREEEEKQGYRTVTKRGDRGEIIKEKKYLPLQKENFTQNDIDQGIKLNNYLYPNQMKPPGNFDYNKKLDLIKDVQPPQITDNSQNSVDQSKTITLNITGTIINNTTDLTAFANLIKDTVATV
jgi:TP901 family phage tail tape measure protein